MISVIIPAYNSGKTIGYCLRALKNQSVRPYEVTEKEKSADLLSRNFEVIVVDDGSIDDTESTVKQFAGVRFIKQEHGGPAAARDLGAKNAHGDILLFTDSDCVPDKNWIAEMAAPFADKNVAGVSGTYRTQQREIIAKFAQYEIEERHAKMAMQKSIDFIGTFSAGYRKKIFDQFKGFDTTFSTSAGEDPELSFRLAEAGHKMVFAPKAIVYHTHPDTLWKYLKQKFRNSYWRVSVYAKRKKTFREGHSYTPGSVVFEAMFAGVSVILLALMAFTSAAYKEINPVSTIYAVLSLSSLLFTVFPSYSLMGHILKKDFAVGAVSPLIILARAFASAFGISSGLLRRLFR